MKDPNSLFRYVFDNSSIVQRWEKLGFDHVGTIFCGKDYDIAFPMNGGFTITNVNHFRQIELNMEMLELIYETKKYILDLNRTCIELALYF